MADLVKFNMDVDSVLYDRWRRAIDPYPMSRVMTDLMNRYVRAAEAMEDMHKQTVEKAVREHFLEEA